MSDPKQVAVDKARELSELTNSQEARELERKGLRKPFKFNLSDEWCLDAADREAKLWNKP